MKRTIRKIRIDHKTESPRRAVWRRITHTQLREKILSMNECAVAFTNSPCCAFRARCFASTSTLSTFVSFLFSFSSFSLYFFLAQASGDILFRALALCGRRRCRFLLLSMSPNYNKIHVHVKPPTGCHLEVSLHRSARKRKLCDNIGFSLECKPNCLPLK